MTVRSMADLRDQLSEVMQELRTSAVPDLARTRAYCEVATVMVNAIRTQVAYASIIKGDLDLPFMEEPLPEPQQPRGPRSVINPLECGPSPEHPWRRIHRLGR